MSSHHIYVHTHEYTKALLEKDSFDNKGTFLRRHIEPLVDLEKEFELIEQQTF